MNHTTDTNRATFLKSGAFGLLAAPALASDVFALGGRAIAAGASPPMAATNPADALERLKAGNARFVAGKPECGPLTARVAELAGGQSPFAIILGCSDSRVPVEIVFDQGPGEVFIVRVAGNYLTNDGLGSIEYSVAVLKSKLIVVLGHTSCGAVSAAVGFVKSGTRQPGHIQDLVTALEPAAKAAKGMPGDWIANAIEENVKQNVREMTARSTIVADAVKSGAVRVVGGTYDLHGGKVTFS
jgi:carbonic anhydrase